jgi:antitoxin component of MazEF toxin-antitoxin module
VTQLMRRKLMKIGGSKALIIPPSLLRVLDIEEEVELKIDDTGTCIILCATPKKEKKK